MSFLRHNFLEAGPPVHRAVARAYYHNAFYRAKLERAGVTPDVVATPEELSRVPFTSRDELTGDPWTLLADARINLAQAHPSTGTTARAPVYIFFSWGDLMRRGLQPLVAEAPGAGLLGIKEGERVINALPYEVSVTGLAMHRALQDGLGACVIPAGKGGFYADPDKTLRMMRALDADHLFTTPSYALSLAERAGDRGTPALSSLWLVGEPCSPAMRHTIERRWAAPAFLYYGSLECGPIGLECRLQDGYHVATNFVHVEVVPVMLPGRPELDGRLGEIVVTVLWRHASPLLRYRTEDFGYWDKRPCPCGVPGRRLHVLGRAADLVADVMPPRFVSEIEDVVLGVDGVSPWFTLTTAGGRLRVLVPQPPAPGVAAAVSAGLQRRLGVGADVTFVAPRPAMGGKLTRLVEQPS